MKIGFWGAGRMGSPLAVNLLARGREVTVYSRDLGRAREIAARGAHGVATDQRRDLVPCDALFTCLALPVHLEEGFLGEGSLYEGMEPGSIHVECSTIGPELAGRLAKAAAARGVGYTQATLGKTPAVAAKAEEPIFVGGDEDVVARAWPLLEEVGRPERVGTVAASCAVKLLSNLVGMANVAVLAEGMRIGRRAGMDPAHLLRLLADTGAHSFQMDVRGPMMAAGSFEPLFTLSLADKDMRLGTEMAHAWNLATPVLDAAKAAFAAGVSQGLGGLDCAALAILRTGGE